MMWWKRQEGRLVLRTQREWNSDPNTVLMKGGGLGLKSLRNLCTHAHTRTPTHPPTHPPTHTQRAQYPLIKEYNGI